MISKFTLIFNDYPLRMLTIYAQSVELSVEKADNSDNENFKIVIFLFESSLSYRKIQRKMNSLIFEFFRCNCKISQRKVLRTERKL
jgi:hypothetical protein